VRPAHAIWSTLAVCVSHMNKCMLTMHAGKKYLGFM
jgi:hypothetical protein